MLIQTRFGDTPQIHEVRVPARRPPPAHVLPRPRRRARAGRAARPTTSSSRRTRAATSSRRSTGSTSRPARSRCSRRRPLAERPRPVVAPGRPPGLRLDAPQRRRPRHLRDGPEGPRLGAAAARGEGRRLGAERLVARRPQARGRRGHLGQRELRLAGRRRTGEKTLVTPKGGEPVAYGGARFSADGKGVYVTTDKRVGVPAPGVRRPRERAGTRYLTSHDPVGRRRLRALARRQDDRVRHQRGRPGACCTCSTPRAARRSRRRSCRVGARGRRSSGTATAATSASSLSSARSPADVYSLDVTTGKLERWTESETGGLNAASFSEPELVRWKSFDGRTISGFLYKPRPALHRPAAR